MNLSEEEFAVRFNPESDGDSFYIPRDWPEDGHMINIAIDERRCWTLRTDSEGQPVIVNGHVLEDRLHSILTSVPYEEGDVFEIGEPRFDENNNN